MLVNIPYIQHLGFCFAPFRTQGKAGVTIKALSTLALVDSCKVSQCHPTQGNKALWSGLITQEFPLMIPEIPIKEVFYPSLGLELQRNLRGMKKLLDCFWWGWIYLNQFRLHDLGAISYWVFTMIASQLTSPDYDIWWYMYCIRLASSYQLKWLVVGSYVHVVFCCLPKPQLIHVYEN